MLLLFDSLPEMLFLHTRYPPEARLVCLHLLPLLCSPIEDPQLKTSQRKEKNQAVAAAALPKKTTRSITHALLHSPSEKKNHNNNKNKKFYTRRRASSFRTGQTVESFLVSKKKKRHAAEGGIKYNFNFNLCIWSGRHLLPFSSFGPSSFFFLLKKMVRNARAIWSHNLLPSLKKSKMLFFFFCIS